MQRICSADYHLPADVEVDPEFQDLLHGMLEPDWTKRMTVSDIIDHPWFAEGLPPGVADMNARLPDGPNPGYGQVSYSLLLHLYNHLKMKGLCIDCL